MLLITREEKFVFFEKSLVTRHFNLGVPELEDTSSAQEICRKCKQWFLLYSPRISDQSSANDNTQQLATTETTAQHGNFNSFHFQNDQMTGQHDWQDERLTGQLPNRFGQCPLTGCYFEPWVVENIHTPTRGNCKFWRWWGRQRPRKFRREGGLNGPFSFQISFAIKKSFLTY